MGKKKKAAEAERIAVLENALKQHAYHISRLEQMLRLLDNNDLAPDQVGIVSAMSYSLACGIRILTAFPAAHFRAGQGPNLSIAFPGTPVDAFYLNAKIH